jgi:hypothetical protein
MSAKKMAARPTKQKTSVAKHQPPIQFKAPARKLFLPNSHTGKLRAHHHTSYGGIALILLAACVPVIVANHVDASSLPPQYGAYSTYAVVPAAIPGQATITTPIGGQVYTNLAPILVRGTCSGQSLIELVVNNVPVGTDLCADGIFSIETALFKGSNTIVARSFNANNSPGPDSLPVTTKLDVPGVVPVQSPFYLTGTQSYLGVEVGQPLQWQVAIAGGKAPYAVSVAWGDGQTSLISRSADGTFTIGHTYKRAPQQQANYTIVVKASDQTGANAYLQLIAIVQGAKQAIASTTGQGSSGGATSRQQLVITRSWQVLGGSALVSASFWVGDRFALRRQIKLRHAV